MAEAKSVVSSVQAAFAARTPPEKIGLALTAIIVLFLLADAIPKIFGAQFSRTATEALGFPSYQTALIGWGCWHARSCSPSRGPRCSVPSR
ncbi:Uncharacterised protein [Mycobacteroides abscessus]|nr:Uncharacterised protein [Mycobacteroides abscessus]